MGMISACFCVL